MIDYCHSILESSASHSEKHSHATVMIKECSIERYKDVRKLHPCACKDGIVSFECVHCYNREN